MLRIAKNTDFDAVYSLLQQSFPADEFRPYAAQKELLSNPGYTAYITDDCSAVITLWQFEGFAFIEHFAVSPACRNQGLGSAVLREVIEMLHCPICLEAELPDTDLSSRRLQFYRRNGFFVNNYPYIQPAYAPELSPVPLLILTTGGPVSESRFASIRDALYRTVYRLTTMND